MEKDSTVDRSLVRELADILNDTDLTEIEVEQGELRIRVSRQKDYMPAPTYAHAMPAQMAPAPMAAPQAAAPQAPAASTGPEVGSVPSPMVGTVYLASAPGAKPFVEIGQTVSEGETILIIEAMKTMNQIPAPHAGVVKRILIEDGSPVEYGAPLMIIE